MMQRRHVLATIAAAIASLLPGVQATAARPLYGRRVWDVSLFSGQGTSFDIDTGLRDRKGKKVSPTIVFVQTTGPVPQKTSYTIHETDTLIDVYITDGATWTAEAQYVE